MSHFYDQLEGKQKTFALKEDTPKLFSIWQHYKGELYLIHGFVMKESTEEFEVCYSNLRRPLPYPWSRPILEWNEMVEYEGKLVKRFTKFEDKAIGEKDH